MSILGGSHGSAKTRHKSVEALLAAHAGEIDPKILVRRLAREKIAYAKSFGWEGPPFCPKVFASIFDIRCREVDHDIGGDGRILLYPENKIWIEYRSKRLPERQRFTIFHEFAHTLFPDYCEFLPLHQTSQKKVPDPEREFENLCDLAAAEMLLPLQEFCGDLAGYNRLGFEAIHELRQRYQASIDATTHRLVELTDSIGCAAVFLTDQRGAHTGFGPLWVKNCCFNSLFKGFIWPGTTPPPNSVAIHCFQNSVETTSHVQETWWIKGKPRTWLVQATKLPSIPHNPDYPKVVALLFPPGYK